MNLMGLGRTPDTFGIRYFVVFHLPTYAASLFLLMLVWAGAPGPHLDFAHAWHTASTLGTGPVLLIALAITLIALMTQPFQIPLIRLLEGYWPAWLEGLAKRRRKALRKSRDAFAKREDDLEAATDKGPDPEAVQRAGAAGAQLRRLFPPDSSIRATRLGNILAAMEHRAGSEYGLDAVVAWPRLYPVLGEQVRTVVDDRRNILDATARLSVVAALTGLAAIGLLYDKGWWLLVAAIPLALSQLAYLGALQAGIAYGESVRSAFDLHRFELLRALHLPLPVDPHAEREANLALCLQWRQGNHGAISRAPYDHSSTAASPDSKA
jgi:hypothetical protein